jgi:hypothetical protein
MRLVLVLALIVIKSMAFAQSAVIREINCHHSIDSAVLTEIFFKAYDKYKLTEEDYIALTPEPKAIVSGKRNIPRKYMRDVVLALSFFPELQDSRIVFKYGKIKGTMNARPDFLNIFRHPSNRKFLLIINSNQGEYRGVNLDSISVNARVGWFGHELSHIYTYFLMNNYQTLLFSIKYLTSQAYVRKAERYTNYLAINKGLTFAIYEGEKYLLMDILISDYYKKRTIDRSLSLNEYKCLWFRFMSKFMNLE